MIYYIDPRIYPTKWNPYITNQYVMVHVTTGKCSAWRSASGSLGNAISEEQ